MISFHIKTLLDDDKFAGQMSEVVEALYQMLLVAIDIQMVGIDGVDDADIGMKLQEGVVELIRFHHDDEIFLFAQQQVAAEVVGDTADEGCGSHPALIEDMGHHRRSGGLSMRARNGDSEMAFGDLAQSLRTLHDGQTLLAQSLKFLQVIRHGRSIDHEINQSRQQIGTVLIVDGHTLLLQLSGQRRRCTVVAGNGATLAMIITSQCAHPDAAYA